MQQREFLQSTIAGAAALVPGSGVAANLDWITSSPAVETLMPIWEAAVEGHWSIVKEWLRRDPTLINVTGEAGLYFVGQSKNTLLHLASAYNSDVELLQHFIDLGADVNAKDDCEWTPLHGAAYLISNGADVHVKDNATFYGNAVFSAGETPLHKAAVRNSVEVMQYLVSQGADIATKNWQNDTLLQEAAATNSIEVMQYLIALGADVNARNSWDATALYFAVNRKREVNILEYLLSQGADVRATTKQGVTLLHEAAQNYPVEVLQYFISGVDDVNSKDSSGYTPLRNLVSQGVDINERDNDGETPLHAAAFGAFTEKLEVLKYLVSQGADVHVKNKDGLTPLHDAARLSDVEVLQYLVSQGADTNVQDNDGRTPLELAKWTEENDNYERTAVIEYLSQITEPKS